MSFPPLKSQLKSQLIKVLRDSAKISEEEKSLLIEAVDLFNDEEVEALISNNQDRG